MVLINVPKIRNWHYNALLIQNRFFECNYGTSGTPFDKIFGTFRDKLKETGTSYRGGSEEKVDDKTAAIHDAKASLAGTNMYTVLHMFTQMLFLAGNHDNQRRKNIFSCKKVFFQTA